MAHVMMGRVQDFENLYIFGKFDEKKIYCNKKALDETMRIEKIAKSWKTKDVCFLSIVSLNIQSLPKHFEDLQADFRVMQKDVVCLQETWLVPMQDGTFTLDGFQSAHTSAGKGKGLVTFSKLTIEENVSLVDINATFQIMTTRVKGVTIISLYISSNCSNLESIANFLSLYKTEKCLVIGDLNFTPETSNLVTKQLKTLNFCQIIETPTHKDGNIIDHVYVSEALFNLTYAELHYVYYSDHQGLLINIVEQ